MMRHHRQYTLIEVLAAVAVLVLMMSFLFQFTSSAQRIWSASNIQTNMADNADAIFTLLDDDLTQMQADSELGMTFVSGSDKYSFYTLSTRSTGEAATDAKEGSLLYVSYQLDATSKKLYRFQKNVEETTNPIFNSSDNSVPNPITFTKDDDHLVADGVESFTMTLPAAAVPGELPAFVRVDVKLDDPKRDADATGNLAAKSYSQVFFIGMR